MFVKDYEKSVTNIFNIVFGIMYLSSFFKGYKIA